MSNAANGEPLALSNAVVKWAAQTVYGTAVAPATSAGIGMAGKRQISGNRRYRGPGSAGVVAKKGGGTYTEYQVRYEAVQSGIKSLLQKAVRVNGTLPFFTLGIGYEDDVTPTSNKSMDQIQDCVLNQLQLSLDTSSDENPLTADLSGFGGLLTVLTNQARSTNTSTPWMSYEAVFQKDTVAFEGTRLQMTVNQNCSRDHVIRGAAPSSFVRGHKYVTPHAEEISGSLTVYAKPGFNVLANTLVSSNLEIVFTNLDDSATLDLLLSGCDFDNLNEEHTAEGIRWSFDFNAKTWALT